MDNLFNIVSKSNKIVFLGGAGTSTESGIPDFRGIHGMGHSLFHGKYSFEEILSHDFFERYPEVFYKYYRKFLIHSEAKPNACHYALAKLEQKKKLIGVITQNIDGLHRQAGSNVVIELHGNIYNNYCVKCHKYYSLEEIQEQSGVPTCVCGGIIKPDVVLYDELLDRENLMHAESLMQQADTLIVGGTSLTVHPAADLLEYFQGRHLVVINQTSTVADSWAELVIREPIGAVFQKLLEHDGFESLAGNMA